MNKEHTLPTQAEEDALVEQMKLRRLSKSTLMLLIADLVWAEKKREQKDPSPDMLAALKSALSGGFACPAAIEEQMRAAIAKAEEA